MIELNKKTQQDFLNREWVQRLLDAGVDMSDAKYLIGNLPFEDSPEDYVYLKTDTRDDMKNEVPTYTVSELLYKLHEWEDNNLGEKRCRGDLCFMPDAPYYMTFFHLVGDETVEIFNDMCGMSGYPIESLASLLIECYSKNIDIKGKI